MTRTDKLYGLLFATFVAGTGLGVPVGMTVAKSRGNAELKDPSQLQLNLPGDFFANLPASHAGDGSRLLKVDTFSFDNDPENPVVLPIVTSEQL